MERAWSSVLPAARPSRPPSHLIVCILSAEEHAITGVPKESSNEASERTQRRCFRAAVGTLTLLTAAEVLISPRCVPCQPGTTAPARQAPTWAVGAGSPRSGTNARRYRSAGGAQACREVPSSASWYGRRSRRRRRLGRNDGSCAKSIKTVRPPASACRCAPVAGWGGARGRCELTGRSRNRQKPSARESSSGNWGLLSVRRCPTCGQSGRSAVAKSPVSTARGLRSEATQLWHRCADKSRRKSGWRIKP